MTIYLIVAAAFLFGAAVTFTGDPPTWVPVGCLAFAAVCGWLAYDEEEG